MKKKFVLFFVLLLCSCQYQEQTFTDNNLIIENKKIKESPKPTVLPSKNTSNNNEMQDIDPNDKEVVTTESEVQKTNVDWKLYNPILKDKKYTYIYTIKNSDSNVSTEILREVISVSENSYKIRQTIISSSKESQLRATELTISINKNNEPSIIPVVSVGGEKLNTNIKIEVTEKPEKIKVPFGEIEAIKVTTRIDNSETTNWYGKDIGLIKSIQIKDGVTYKLELKDFK